MKLAIIDDHPLLRQGFAALIARHWPTVEVLHAGDGAHALALAASHADLRAAVLDLLLPGESGLAVLTALRQTRPDMPVIVLTSSDDQADWARAQALGAAACIAKSDGDGALLRALGAALALPSDAARPVLTARQIEVLRLVAAGRPNKTIADTLGIAEKTVKAHLAAIFLALGASNRTHAIALARRVGII